MVETMVSDSHFQSQLASIMEMLAKTAVLEISKLVEESHAVFRREISRRISENQGLKKKCDLLESELKASRRSAQEGHAEGQADRAPCNVPNKGTLFHLSFNIKHFHYHSYSIPVNTSYRGERGGLGQGRPGTVCIPIIYEECKFQK